MVVVRWSVEGPSRWLQRGLDVGLIRLCQEQKQNTCFVFSTLMFLLTPIRVSCWTTPLYRGKVVASNPASYPDSYPAGTLVSEGWWAEHSRSARLDCLTSFVAKMKTNPRRPNMILGRMFLFTKKPRKSCVIHCKPRKDPRMKYEVNHMTFSSLYYRCSSFFIMV